MEARRSPTARRATPCFPPVSPLALMNLWRIVMDESQDAGNEMALVSQVAKRLVAVSRALASHRQPTSLSCSTVSGREGLMRGHVRSNCCV